MPSQDENIIISNPRHHVATLGDTSRQYLAESCSRATSCTCFSSSTSLQPTSCITISLEIFFADDGTERGHVKGEKKRTKKKHRAEEIQCLFAGFARSGSERI